MDFLFSLFPNPDSGFGLLGVILGLPAIGAFFNGVFGKRLGSGAVRLMAVATVVGSFILSLLAFLMLHHASNGTEAVRFAWTAWHWVSLENSSIDVTFSVDNLSALMILIVTGVGALIHIYATGYLHGDPGYHRFFAYMNLFILAMLVLVLADSLPILFVGWEGVGLCSYLLIGFWFDEEKNASAGKKAFIANRIGDFGLLVAMAILAYMVGSLSWSGMQSQAGVLLTQVQIWPIGASGWGHPIYVNAATLVGLALFLGCVGKSAQIPLYVWLPDAMAGPTPVSALIHAATMVTAGVYLVARMNFVFLLSPTVMMIVAGVGAATALLAATIALVQNDLKKVLAYSTVSQLGYMFMAVGVGAFGAGMFHLMTHAFFKAALFLAAGSIIHAMHVRIHSTDASQDMRNMGGLRKHLRATYVSYVAATLAIAGMPLTSGFFSKDEILISTWVNRIQPSPALRDMMLRALPRGADAQTKAAAISSLGTPDWFSKAVFAIGLIAAVLTAFYMFRSLVLTFFGEFRGWKVVPGYKPTDPHAHEPTETADADREHGRKPLEGPEPPEAPRSMTVPVLILAALALVAGFVNTDLFRLSPLVEQWLHPVFRAAADIVKPAVESEDALKSTEHVLLGCGIAAFLVGSALAWWIYEVRRGKPAAQIASAAPGLYRLLVDKWRVDELYQASVIGFVDALADSAAWFDRWVIDGIVARLTALVVTLTGSAFRLVQNGKVQMYAAVMVVGLASMGWFVVWPHADLAVTVTPRDTFVLRAAPGLGYRYRWDLDGDGRWDDGDMWLLQASTDLRSPPEPGESRKVRVQVKNVFGLTAIKELTLSVLPPDRSAPELRPRAAAQGVSP